MYYQQQQHQSNNYKEPDQDSIGSASGVSGNINNSYRYLLFLKNFIF